LAAPSPLTAGLPSAAVRSAKRLAVSSGSAKGSAPGVCATPVPASPSANHGGAIRRLLSTRAAMVGRRGRDRCAVPGQGQSGL